MQSESSFWGEGNIPESIGVISRSFNDDGAIFDDMDIVFGEDGGAIVVA